MKRNPRARIPSALVALLLLAGVGVVLALPATAAEAATAAEGRELGTELPLWSAAPFLGILLSIALFPLFAPHFWHRHFGRIAAGWGLLFAVPFLLQYRGAATHAILATYLEEFLPFIVLLGSLFVVSGGIVVRGSFAATPQANVLFLLAGTVLASFVGTTGASMLLLRPLLRANAPRRHKAHIVVFFIFLVSNIGGSLTPLGDPPLFLGFLQGVPFFWTLRLLPAAAFTWAVLLTIFFFLDRRHFRRDLRAVMRAARRESPPSPEAVPPVPARASLSLRAMRIQVQGLRNLLFLAGIVGAVLLSGFWHPGAVRVLGVHLAVEDLVREGLMLLMAFLCYRFTSPALRRENGFSWFPIKEVTYLFAGIFITMLPALAILRAGADGAMAFVVEAVRTPAHFFWAAGGLSSFLDNAPTYLTFLNLSLGRFFPHLPPPEALAGLISREGIFLEAISLGAVFMGANTYIGNAPNFMVRSMAEESGVRMPSFLGYMVRYSLPILIPTFLLVGWIFMRP